MIQESDQQQRDKAKALLTEFKSDFEQYLHWIRTNMPQSASEIREELELREPATTHYLLSILGEIQYQGIANTSMSNLVSNSLLARPGVFSLGTDLDPVEIHGRLVLSAINRAIGQIAYRMWPRPVLAGELDVENEILRDRCLALIRSGTPADTIIREATTVFESLVRESVPIEILSAVVPDTRDLVGEKLVNRLMSPKSAVISVSDDERRRIAFHKICIGVIAYPRNESHHGLDNNSQITWAWAVVGLVDQLLRELKGAHIIDPR